MKTIIKIGLVLFLLQVSFPIFSSGGDTDEVTLKVPENALILSESTNERGVIYTMIDLENNEMVIVCYGLEYASIDLKYLKLRKVIRTGITINLEKQLQQMNNDSKIESLIE